MTQSVALCYGVVADRHGSCRAALGWPCDSRCSLRLAWSLGLECEVDAHSPADGKFWVVVEGECEPDALSFTYAQRGTCYWFHQLLLNL